MIRYAIIAYSIIKPGAGNLQDDGAGTLQRRDAEHAGLLLTFEGIDGSGKTTQARLLAEALDAEGHRPLLVREPGGTAVSERVRTLLLDVRLEVAPMAELLLFSAARAQLCAERIRPALAAGRVVLCDRFFDSTTAYQGAGRGVADPGWLDAFHRRVTGGLVPDRTYLVELPPAAALRRRQRRASSEAGAPADRMETAEADFYERVAAAYAVLAQDQPGRFLRLDGTRPIAAIQEDIRADVRRLLAARTGTAVSSGGSSE